MKLHSYVVPRDYGFAPNPFHGICTLATCKPKIRGYANIGDLVIGTRSSPRRNEIVYFMEVSEVLSFEEYWEDERFKAKKPNLHASNKHAYGDNIYHKDSQGRWIQEDSHHTHEDGSPILKNIKKDTSYNRVLIGEVFSYWGKNSVTIPDKFKEIIKKGPGHKSKFDRRLLEEVKEWLFSQERGLLGDPLAW